MTSQTSSPVRTEPSRTPPRIRALVADRTTGLPAWVVLTQLFIGLGWLRAATEKLIDSAWWDGSGITSFLAEHDGLTVGWYEPILDVIVTPRLRAILRELGMGTALNDGRISTEMVDWYYALLRDTPTLRNDTNLPRELLQKTGKGVEALPASLLAEVQCPVLFVWGEDDPMGGSAVATSFVRSVLRGWSTRNGPLQRWPASSSGDSLSSPSSLPPSRLCRLDRVRPDSKPALLEQCLATLEDARDILIESGHLAVVVAVEAEIRALSRRLGFDGPPGGDHG